MLGAFPVQGEQDAAVLHLVRVVAGRKAIGQPPETRAIKPYRVKVRRRGGAVLVEFAAQIADESDLIGRPGVIEVKQGRLVHRATAISRVVSDLANAGSIRGHLEDVPGIGRLFPGCEQNAFAIERDRWIGGAVEVRRQDADGSVRAQHYNPAAIPIRATQHAGGYRRSARRPCHRNLGEHNATTSGRVTGEIGISRARRITGAGQQHANREQESTDCRSRRILAAHFHGWKAG